MIDNNNKYEGEWKNASGGYQRHGKGIQVWQDGSIYEGQWMNDRANGTG